MSQCLAKRCVFKFHLKRSDSAAGSCNESGSEFQTEGPATEKVRVPKVLRRNGGIFYVTFEGSFHVYKEKCQSST